MQFNVNIRPFKWQNSNAKITVKFDNAAINNWLNARWGLYSGFQIWWENRILEKIEPFIPRDTGALIQSAHKNTPRGSGKIVWGGGGLSRPYAVFQYFNQNVNPKINRGQRGAFWLTRFNNANGFTNILNEGASKFGFTART